MKKKLQRLIEAARDREAAELLPMVDDTPPSGPGKWTPKDHLAHLTAWRLVAVDELDAVRTGRRPQSVSDVDDVENAKIYKRTHRRPAAALIDEGSNSWAELSAAVEDCTREDLAKPRPHHADQPAWQAVPGNGYFHLAEHLAYLHTERGDHASAESAAKWAHEMAVTADARGRATADYNLACFYAARGRAEEAMPLLRSGLKLRPDLRDWAKKDKDLDPIRSTPELAKLLS